MDFYNIKERSLKSGITEVYPDFRVCRSKDLMVRGKSFYAIWDEHKGLWSTDEYDVQRIVDDDLGAYAEKKKAVSDGAIHVRYMSGFSSNSWVQFCNYVSHLPDSHVQLDEKLTFADTKVKKTDYVSKRLPYSLSDGDISAYEELIGTLYAPEEKAKLEWAIGSIICGDSQSIQKFIVLYGPMGTGKSTVINIIEKLFAGYWTTFEAKALVSSSNAFSTEVFKTNPLVAIQHDGDLSRIEDNTKLNSIVSHEEMTMNEKYKPSYTAKANCFLFLGTNKPVRITDAKSGIIRRLISVSPTGKKLPPKRYHVLKNQIDFELGAIAQHCLNKYREMGKYYYDDYIPLDMIQQTDTFFNFVEANYEAFKKDDGVSLSRAYDMYKTYCDQALVDFKLPRHKFREEFKNYFHSFDDVTRLSDGKQVRSYYSGFATEKFVKQPAKSNPSDDKPLALVLDQTESLLDEMLSEMPAQLAVGEDETPGYKWDDVKTKLKDIDTHKTHYVRVPKNHIVIDFDLKNDKGEKDAVLNLEAASKWPITYAEYSKGGAGIHLHYIYAGDPTELSCMYDDDIEIKVFTGKQSLRRRLSFCNNVPVQTIYSGLPLKEKKVITPEKLKSEHQLRVLVLRALNKEIPPYSTKPNIDFIAKILDDAYESGMVYDLTQLRPRVLVFANNSTHNASYCVKKVSKMRFSSEVLPENREEYDSDELVFFDCEVFPNLFLVNYKLSGDHPCIRMINPEPKDIEKLFRYKLVGFNCRRYDNHILYARYLGYSNEELFNLSQKIVSGSRNAFFGQAYNLSYTDVLDFSAKKQSLKLFEIELGIHHLELGLPWDKPVPEEMWKRVAEYCDNDVIATEAVFNARKGDFVAREILAELAGMTVNDTTNSLTTRIIFGDNRNPQSLFNYRDLGCEDGTERVELFGDPYSLFVDGKPVFPGYTNRNGKSIYRGIEIGEGGFVWASPGYYYDVITFDVMSMHPHSVKAENLFGEYTEKFCELLDIRAAIKHKEFDKVRTMMDGKLAKYMDDPGLAKALSNALKIAINSVYGLTAASFDNPFRDPRNKDNIVAKRGALFMCNLLHAVQQRGGTVVHIKTDSIKVASPSNELCKFIMDYGKAYGYTFEIEHKFDKICLVNDAVYIAHCAKDDPDANDEELLKHRLWTATGKQFQIPYIFKTLFSKEPIQFDDLCETRTVTTALYLDMDEDLPDGDHSYHFVGKAGSFCPVKPGSGGGLLLRENDGKYSYVSKAKGRRWLEAETIRLLNWQSVIDRSYYEDMAKEAKKAIEQFCCFEEFVAVDTPPWNLPCGDSKFDTCFDCPRFGYCAINEGGQHG